MLDVRPGTERVLLETIPLTRVATQISMRFAQQVACKELQRDCSRQDFIYTITAQPGLVGGPSAGAAGAVLTVSLLEGFRTNWNNPAYGSEEWPGCWFKLSIADVDFFMLDGRFYRTNPYTEKPSMLGPEQKAWFLKELGQSQATFKVLASPVPWSFNTKNKSRDTWNGFRDERNEILRWGHPDTGRILVRDGYGWAVRVTDRQVVAVVTYRREVGRWVFGGIIRPG